MLIIKPALCIRIHHFTATIRTIPRNVLPPIHRTYTTSKLNRNSINKIANLFHGNHRRLALITKRFTTTNVNNGAQQVAKESGRTNRSDFYRLLVLGRKEKFVFLAAMGCLLVSSSITMGVPYSIGRILDIIFTEQVAKEKLKEFCAILVGIFIVGGLANFGRIYLMNGACECDIFSLSSSNEIFSHFFPCSSSYNKRSSSQSLSNNDQSRSWLVRYERYW